MAGALSRTTVIGRYACYLSAGLLVSSLAAVYVATVNTLISMVAVLYLSLCLNRRNHSVLRFPLPDKSRLSEAYQCINMEGDLALCQKEECRGLWKPPRAHHCSTCGVCRLGFDHHCPWVCWLLRHFISFWRAPESSRSETASPRRV